MMDYRNEAAHEMARALGNLIQNGHLPDSIILLKKAILSLEFAVREESQGIISIPLKGYRVAFPGEKGIVHDFKV